MKKKVIYTEVPNFVKIELVDYYDQFLSYYPKCEMETKEWVVKHCKKDWVIFDCGATIGYYSILFAKLAYKGKVYSFEPTDTIEKLKNNLSHNSINNVKIIKAALGNKTSVIKDKIYKIWEHEVVEDYFNFITIDDFVKEYNIEKLDLIKIDVDSYDFEVLKGAEQTLNRFNPFVIVELNHALNLRNTSNYHAIEWMKDKGYDAGLILDHENIVFKKYHKFRNVKTFRLMFKKN